jgi:hypothetical protein
VRYLEETGLEVEDVYDGGRSWSELRAEAGIPFSAPGPKALAEAAAILVLRKKAEALWGDEDASTESKNDDESSN